MKRGGNFFFSHLWGEQKEGTADFLFHFLSGGEKYVGHYAL